MTNPLQAAPASNRHLLIFARRPELGCVKTRLAADLGNEAALSVYCRLLAHTRAVTTPLAARQIVWLAKAGPAAASFPDEWSGYEQQPQPPGDLGQKMQAAFAQSFARGATAVVVIGTDCPGLTTDHLTAAFRALETHDVVLGPATDGGYYLLGMKQLWPDLFQNKAWSTETVRAATEADVQRLQLGLYLLPELRDVDTAADLRAWEAAAG